MSKYKVIRAFSTYDSFGKLNGKPKQVLTVGVDMTQSAADRLEAAGLLKKIKPRKKAAEA